MIIRMIEEEPLYTYYPYGGNGIELYHKDFDNIKVGDEFKTDGWSHNVNATEHMYVTVTCVYKDTKGVLLREYTEIIYLHDSYDIKEDVDLVWVELQSEDKK